MKFSALLEKIINLSNALSMFMPSLNSLLFMMLLFTFYNSPFFVSPELSSVRDYVITHSVRSMYVYVCVCMYVYVCGILQN